MPEDEKAKVDQPPNPSGWSLVACIAHAQATFGSLPKDTKAVIRSDKGNYDYDYISEGAIYDRVRALLSPMGVAVFISTVSTEKRQGGSTWVVIEIRFRKGDETETIRGEAEGVDPRDKSYNKAITTAVRLALTKQFMQGGDLDPEQTANEPTRPLPGKAAREPGLSESQLKRLRTKAIDSGVVDEHGSLDVPLLCRIASFAHGEQIGRVDAIPGSVFVKLVDGPEGKPPMLDGFAASRTKGLEAIREMEVERGW